MNLTLEQVQEKSCELFRTVVRILEEENFPYVGFYGTMLGTVRHHGQIPWDSDADIAIPEPELERFLDILKRRLPPEYWVDFGDADKPVRAIPRIGLTGYETRVLHLDVFRMIGYPKARWKQILFNKYCCLLISLRCAKTYTYTGKKRVQAGIVRALTCFLPADYFARRYHKMCKRYPYETAETIGNATDHNGVERVYTKEIFDAELMPYADFQIRIPKTYDALLRLLYGEYMRLPPEKDRAASIQKTYEIKPLEE